MEHMTLSHARETATQHTEEVLLALLAQERTLVHDLAETRREIGLALSAHRRASPAVGVREISAISGVNRTTLWEVEIGRAWRRTTPVDLIRVARVISDLRAKNMAAEGYDLDMAGAA